jgi:hypothetical protein
MAKKSEIARNVEVLVCAFTKNKNHSAGSVEGPVFVPMADGSQAARIVQVLASASMAERSQHAKTVEVLASAFIAE